MLMVGRGGGSSLPEALLGFGRLSHHMLYLVGLHKGDCRLRCYCLGVLSHGVGLSVEEFVESFGKSHC